VVCLERLEHFLRERQKEGVTVLLAGLRAEFLTAIGNLRFADWYPTENIYAEEDSTYSATLRAVRHAYRLLGEANRCEHCSQRAPTDHHVSNLYYLV